MPRQVRPDWFGGRLFEPSRWVMVRVEDAHPDEWLSGLVLLLTRRELGLVPVWEEFVSRRAPILNAVTTRDGAGEGMWELVEWFDHARGLYRAVDRFLPPLFQQADWNLRCTLFLLNLVMHGGVVAEERPGETFEMPGSEAFPWLERALLLPRRVVVFILSAPLIREELKTRRDHHPGAAIAAQLGLVPREVWQDNSSFAFLGDRESDLAERLSTIVSCPRTKARPAVLDVGEPIPPKRKTDESSKLSDRTRHILGRLSEVFASFRTAHQDEGETLVRSCTGEMDDFTNIARYRLFDEDKKQRRRDFKRESIEVEFQQRSTEAGDEDGVEYRNDPRVRTPEDISELRNLTHELDRLKRRYPKLAPLIDDMLDYQESPQRERAARLGVSEQTVKNRYGELRRLLATYR